MIENELPHPSISQRTFLKQSPHLEDREKKRVRSKHPQIGYQKNNSKFWILIGRRQLSIFAFDIGKTIDKKFNGLN